MKTIKNIFAILTILFVCLTINAQSYHGGGVVYSENSTNTDSTVVYPGQPVVLSIDVYDLDDFIDTLTVNSITVTTFHSTGPVTANLLTVPIKINSYYAGLGGYSVHVDYVFPVLDGDETLGSLQSVITVNGVDNHDGFQGTLVKSSFNSVQQSQITVVSAPQPDPVPTPSNNKKKGKKK